MVSGFYALSLNDKHIKRLKRFLCCYHFCYESPRGPDAAPADQCIELHPGAGGTDVNRMIWHVLHIAGYTERSCFFPGALAVIHTLHLSLYDYGNGLPHITIR